MKEFGFLPSAANIVFGVGALARLPALLRDQGLRRPLILSTPGRRAALSGVLRELPAVGFARVAPHVPAEIVDEAVRMARDAGADCTISIGGGSATGLGKLLRLRSGLPQIAIPTTYAGSEMTNLWGITENRTKRTGRDAVVTPMLVLYDPALLVSLPRAIAGPSALNAFAQAAANLPGFYTDPIPNAFAREAIILLGRALPRLLNGRVDVEICGELLQGAALAGAALGTGGTGLHHRLCHVLGGTFNLPHADTHAVLLPYTLAFNRPAAPEAMALLSTAIGVPDAPAGMHALMRQACAKPSLRELGLSEGDLDGVADAALATPVSNPVPAERKTVARLLRGAFAGDPPR